MHGCEQSPFHHLDVFEHTLQVLDASADIAAHPEHYLPRHAESLRAALDQTVGDELDARTALRLAVLFHDIEKPSTRTVSDDGRIGFMGHDRKGAETAERVLKRWRAAHVDDPLLRAARRRAPAAGLHGARAAVRPPRRPTATCEADGAAHLESVVLSLADRFATRGRPRPSGVRARPHRDGRRADPGRRRRSSPRIASRCLRGDEIAELTGASGAADRRAGRRPGRGAGGGDGDDARRGGGVCQRVAASTAPPSRYAAHGGRARLVRVSSRGASPAPDDRALDVAGGPGVAGRGAPAAGSGRSPCSTRRRGCSSSCPTGSGGSLGRAEQLPFDDGSFDLVTCVNSLHHIARPPRALDEMARVLAPGGRIVLEDFIADDDPARARRWEEIERLRDPEHGRLITRRRAARAAARGGPATWTPRRCGCALFEVDPWLEVAGCSGSAGRARARADRRARRSSCACGAPASAGPSDSAGRERQRAIVV